MPAAAAESHPSRQRDYGGPEGDLERHESHATDDPLGVDPPTWAAEITKECVRIGWLGPHQADDSKRCGDADNLD